MPAAEAWFQRAVQAGVAPDLVIYSTLMWAAASGNPEVVKMLLKHATQLGQGAQGDLLIAQDQEGFTALMCAASHGHTKTAKALLEEGLVL